MRGRHCGNVYDTQHARDMHHDGNAVTHEPDAHTTRAGRYNRRIRGIHNGPHGTGLVRQRSIVNRRRNERGTLR